jgi:hypothetical protein
MITDITGEQIALWPPQGGTVAQCANARLIAAAPAMLRALLRLVHPMADDDDLSHALDVIARATGQPVPEPDEGPEPPYAGYESEAQLQRMAEARALRAKGQA